jgi:hypothetical protein
MKRKAIVVFAILMTLGILVSGRLSGKEKKQYNVAVKLERVEREPAIENTKSYIVKDGQLFENRTMAVIWAPGPNGFRFRIYNKSKEEITILWNECVFVNEKGNRYYISHKGVKRPSLSKMKTMKPTVVQGGDNWQDVFFPFDSDYIEHQKELKRFGKGGIDAVSTYGKAGLRIKNIYTPQYHEKQVNKIMKKLHKKDKNATFESYLAAQTFALEMVLKIAEIKYTYRYYFKSVLMKK